MIMHESNEITQQKSWHDTEAYCRDIPSFFSPRKNVCVCEREREYVCYKEHKTQICNVKRIINNNGKAKIAQSNYGRATLRQRDKGNLRKGKGKTELANATSHSPSTLPCCLYSRQ